MSARMPLIPHFRPLLVATGLWAAALSTVALAAENVTIVAAKVDPLPLYAAPGDAAAAGSTAASSLPLEVREVRGDFMRVNVGGRDMWVDAMTVRASHKTAARCGAVAVNGAKVAGEMGAGSDRCK